MFKENVFIIYFFNLLYAFTNVTGLDPAKPLIDLFTMDEFRLTRDDADFVEVIHTNSGVYGEYPQIGHVDFCVNGGRMQPICLTQANIIRNILYIFIIFNNNVYYTYI